MAIDKLKDGLKQMKRSDMMFSYLNVTPEATTADWALIGETTNLGISYNPQKTTEKLVVEDNARTTHDSNQKSSDVTLKCCVGDPIFEYIAGCRDKLQCETDRLDIDPYSGKDGTYDAKKQKVLITISSWAGENGECEFTTDYQGDPEEGSVSITGGKPVFTPKA